MPSEDSPKLLIWSHSKSQCEFSLLMNLDEEVKSNTKNDVLQANHNSSIDYEDKNEPTQKLDEFANMSHILRNPTKEINRSRHNLLPPLEHTPNQPSTFNKAKGEFKASQGRIVTDTKYNNSEKVFNISQHAVQELQQTRVFEETKELTKKTRRLPICVSF